MQWSVEKLLKLYRLMFLIRTFEERCLRLSYQGQIAGSIHLCVGQEAVAVGAAEALQEEDLTVTTYRGHGHVLARGVDPYRAFAEMLGRRSGLCGGKGGSMHLTAVAQGVLPPNSIVAAGLPIATGVALAQRYLRRTSVVLCTFGEGALNQGAAHEALNLAAIWDLPVIFLCENNGYAEMTPAYSMIKGESFAARVRAYGIATYEVDGMDVCAVAEGTMQAVEQARAGQGPIFIEARTYRFLGHYQADPGTAYRSAEEVQRWRARDPLKLLRARLCEQQVDTERMLTALEEEVKAYLEECERRALADPWPEAEVLTEGVYASIQA
ncbi:thiamine pyrophosphate-dependent dehydrogenase E1 component subunit alpha [Thermogemmatispora carboxidivorans]|uniref:thiamine pyrophosphate-dependent dehydrogenase E1 component subunit alpha n=1 Tax=Thermogemmatispora carboxidivorans TaxID=1382306 RepID=UPI00069BACA1|nr:thiamine pyrophosphate-dependent dehydrogenase E1 component subunit alpha [Thermogemmatispora carboxidivorans]